jgi:hypothetical protein
VWKTTLSDLQLTNIGGTSSGHAITRAKRKVVGIGRENREERSVTRVSMIFITIAIVNARYYESSSTTNFYMDEPPPFIP